MHVYYRYAYDKNTAQNPIQARTYTNETKELCVGTWEPSTKCLITCMQIAPSLKKNPNPKQSFKLGCLQYVLTYVAAVPTVKGAPQGV